MMCYSIELRDQMFVKKFKNLVKNISKNLSGKCSRKLLDHAKILQQMQSKLLPKKQKLLRKIAEATGDLIGNKIADKIAKVSKGSP